MCQLNDEWCRYGLLAYGVAYFMLAVVWRSFMVYRRTGVNPIVLPSSDDAYGFVGRAFRFVVFGCAVVVSIIAFAGQAPVWLGAYEVLQSRAVSSAGWLLLCVPLPWLLVAQAQMGASWRIGIDSQRHTELVARGLFTVSRNPIYLALRLNLLGLFFVFPAAATLALLVAGEILVQVQVRLEEQHLSQLHGRSYASYCSRVRRWL